MPTLTSRERFLASLGYGAVDRVFYFPTDGWPETEERWRREGWDGRPLVEVFDTDRLIWCGHLFYPHPPFVEETVAEDETTRTYTNHEGITLREFKDHRHSSMPQFLRFPVETPEEFREFARARLRPELAPRMGAEAEALFARWNGRTAPFFLGSDRWGGFFGPLRNLLGVERLCMLFYDDPAFLEEIMDYIADYIIRLMAQILDRTTVDIYAFWEDMAYKTGPLIGPDMVRTYMLPRYRRVVEFLRRRGVPHISLDSDGDIMSLIPIWLEAGIDTLYPFEVQCGMDVNRVRREFGRDLRLLGNFDKRAIVKGRASIDAEFDRIRPVLREGGYIPWVDHSCPPDISWPHFRYYMDRLRAECAAARR
jgi:uroporphyrinogen decarboxylase